MSVLKQGENLEEEESQVLDNTGESENESDKNSIGNIRKYAVIAAIAVLGIAVIFLFSRDNMKGVKEKNAEEDVADEEVVEFDEDVDPDAAFDEMLSSTEEEMESVYVDYSDYEIEQLRTAGYTGDEIEVSSEMGISCDTLLEEAQAAREADIKRQVKELGKKGSEAYKQLMYKTYLVNELNNHVKTKGADEVYAEQTTTREIVDYEKLEVHGSQLWIMCHLNSGEKGFFLCTTSRWEALPKKGNIVVDVTREIYKKQSYIISIVEIPQ